jgi:hypothetical protein
MATTLGSLILELGLDDKKFKSQMDAAKANALKAGQGVERKSIIPSYTNSTLTSIAN